MRIIAGKYKGRKLFSPADDSIRPTSDRTRESLFNLLMHGKFGGDNIIDQPIADFCCGTGALGLEALSRGASSCLFIDNSTASLALAKKNAAHLGIYHQETSQEHQRPRSGGVESRSERGPSPLSAHSADRTHLSESPVRASEPQLLFLTMDVSQLTPAPHPCACILFDAPYNSPFLAKTLLALQTKGWLLPDALVCLEQRFTEKPIEVEGLTLIDTREYGKTTLRIYRAA